MTINLKRVFKDIYEVEEYIKKVRNINFKKISRKEKRSTKIKLKEAFNFIKIYIMLNIDKMSDEEIERYKKNEDEILDIVIKTNKKLEKERKKGNISQKGVMFLEKYKELLAKKKLQFKNLLLKNLEKIEIEKDVEKTIENKYQEIVRIIEDINKYYVRKIDSKIIEQMLLNSEEYQYKYSEKLNIVRTYEDNNKEEKENSLEIIENKIDEIVRIIDKNYNMLGEKFIKIIKKAVEEEQIEYTNNPNIYAKHYNGYVMVNNREDKGELVLLIHELRSYVF